MNIAPETQPGSQAPAPFNFNGHAVRAITKDDGSAWFVAKDVCDVLGYADAAQAVKVNCKHPELLKNVSGTVLEIPPRGLLIVGEPDLYRLMLKSTKPEAQKFERWVMEEVLPTLRRTGTYTMPATKTPAPPAAISPKLVKEISQLHRDLIRTAKTFGLSPEQAALSASQAVRKLYNINFVDLLAIPGIESPAQVRHRTPSELGRPHGLSGRAFNTLLWQHGLQERDEHGHWRPTARGAAHAVLVDTTKRHHNGTPVQQLRWLESVCSAVVFDDDF